MTTPEHDQMIRRGVVKSVETKGYGNDGKSMTTIRIEAEGFKGKVIPLRLFLAAHGDQKAWEVGG